MTQAQGGSWCRLPRLSGHGHVPKMEDVLRARVKTGGAVVGPGAGDTNLRVHHPPSLCVFTSPGACDTSPMAHVTWNNLLSPDPGRMTQSPELLHSSTKWVVTSYTNSKQSSKFPCEASPWIVTGSRTGDTAPNISPRNARISGTITQTHNPMVQLFGTSHAPSATHRNQ